MHRVYRELDHLLKTSMVAIEREKKPMPIVDTTRSSDVWRLLRRARSIYAGLPHKNASIHSALERASKYYSFSTNELSWARASTARSKAAIFPALKKTCTDDLSYASKKRLLLHALKNTWAPRQPKTPLR